jgi:hypothetical protein
MKHNGVAFTKKYRKRFDHKSSAEHSQADILRGMKSEMPPMQAIVFMSLFHQFPERFIYGEDNFFRPDALTTCVQLRIKRRAYWAMTHNLERLGYVRRRRASTVPWRREVRINFDKLAKFKEGKK